MCIYESKVNKGSEITDYTVFNLEKKSNKYPLPAIHGLHVYISDRLSGLCSEIPDMAYFVNQCYG